MFVLTYAPSTNIFLLERKKKKLGLEWGLSGESIHRASLRIKIWSPGNCAKNGQTWWLPAIPSLWRHRLKMSGDNRPATLAKRMIARFHKRQYLERLESNCGKYLSQLQTTIQACTTQFHTYSKTHIYTLTHTKTVLINLLANTWTKAIPWKEVFKALTLL